MQTADGISTRSTRDEEQRGDPCGRPEEDTGGSGGDTKAGKTNTKDGVDRYGTDGK